jgi:hypothetical protein
MDATVKTNENVKIIDTQVLGLFHEKLKAALVRCNNSVENKHKITTKSANVYSLSF